MRLLRALSGVCGVLSSSPRRGLGPPRSYEERKPCTCLDGNCLGAVRFTRTPSNGGNCHPFGRPRFQFYMSCLADHRLDKAGADYNSSRGRLLHRSPPLHLFINLTFPCTAFSFAFLGRGRSTFLFLFLVVCALVPSAETCQACERLSHICSLVSLCCRRCQLSQRDPWPL
jgi:hypothetical protein